MKIFMVGGTGLLGAVSAEELIRRGHEVITVSLPPLPDKEVLPEKMGIIIGNILEMDDQQISHLMKDCDAFVFAAGVDERVEFPKPAIDHFIKYNVDPVKRLLEIAKKSGVKKAVIMGSYFAYFAKVWPQLKLAERHPYIKSRILQEEAALGFSDDNMKVMVLELPYIFGTQPGRKPVWTFLVKAIKDMKYFTFFTKGGTTMVTINQVAQAVAGAIEKGKGGTCYPVGWYNKTWKELLSVFHENMDIPNQKIITIPTFLYKMKGKKIMNDSIKKGIDPGLDMVHFADIQTSKTFIDKSIIRDELGVTDDDIDKAIRDSVKLCLEALSEKNELLEMKAE